MFLAPVTLLALALVLVGAAVWSARATASALHLRPFRWFDAGPAEDRTKRFIVCAVSSLSGLAVAIALSILTHFVEGKSVHSLEVRVLEGQPAAVAGMRNGDHIVSIDGVRMTTSDQVRAAVSASGNVKRIEIRRQNAGQYFDVSPQDGRIGIEFVEHRVAFPIPEALAGGVTAPFELWAATARSVMGTSQTELAGPVAIVRATDSQSERPGAVLRLIAIMASLYWPAIAAVHLFAALTRIVFERTYPHPASSGPAPDRTATTFRLHQALLLSLACLPFALVGHAVLDLAGADWAGLIILLIAPATISLYPLVWSLDQSRLPRPSYFRSALLVIPCIAPFAAIGAIFASRRRLRAAGLTQGLFAPHP